MVNRHDTCNCGRMKRKESKECIKCSGYDHGGKTDKYTPIIQAEYEANRGKSIRAVARELSLHNEKLQPLTERVIRQRLIRARQLAEEREKDALIERNFAIVKSPVNLNQGARLWKHIEEDTSEYLEVELEANQRTLALDGNQPVGITFLADQHIGSQGTDHKRAREDAELVARTDGLFAILGGDTYDNHIKHLAAIINSKSPPTDQIKMFLYYIGLFKHKILAIISGNHEWWTKQFAGIDVLKMFMEQERISYSAHEFKLTLTLSTQQYRILVKHKTRFNSAFNVTHTIKQHWRLGDWDFDIGFRGDEHQASIEPFQAHGRQHWAARGGTYQLISEHADLRGHTRPPLPLCPTFILYPREHRIDGYEDLHKALVPLKAARAAEIAQQRRAPKAR